MHSVITSGVVASVGPTTMSVDNLMKPPFVNPHMQQVALGHHMNYQGGPWDLIGS